jgi:exodeoxyribonuclease VII large subunit
MAVPVRADLMQSTRDFGRRLHLATRRLADRRRADLRSAARALPSLDALIATPRQRLDLVSSRLARGLERNAARHRASLVDLQRRLLRLSPQARVAGLRAKLDGLGDRLSAARFASLRSERQKIDKARQRVRDLDLRRGRAFGILLEKRRTRVGNLAQLLSSLSYQGVLQRGYALVTDDQGQVLRRAADAKTQAHLTLRFADGEIGAKPQK